MYPLPFPSFPNSLGNSFSFLFSPHLAQFNHLSSSVCVMQIWAAETEPISPSAHESSGGADRKDEFFRLNVPPFFTQLHGIKATFLCGALVYFSPLHSASPVVKCMNKDRESRTHTPFLCIYHHGYSHSFWQRWFCEGSFLSWRLSKYPPRLSAIILYLKRKEDRYSGCPGQASDWQPALSMSRAEASVLDACRHNTIIPTYP